MSKTKDKKIEKWIDLSSLPKQSNGRIDWKKSEGCEVAFKYGNHIGVIKILERKYGTNDVIVYIDGYTGQEGRRIDFNKLACCKIGGIFRKSIAETHPHLIKYFYTEDEAHRYSYGSNKKVKMICPCCGTIKYQSIDRLVRQGFGCSACSDGISYPNKFIFNLLHQLTINFKNEISKSTPGFEWVGNYKYDFYFEKNNKKYFIEADGGFHRYNDVKSRDEIKNCLAREHGIDTIRIDCDYKIMSKRYSFIKRQILNSELSCLFDMSDIDWGAINTMAIESYVAVAADCWNNNYKICDIAKEICVSEQTVTSYLKIAAEIGLCDYSVEESEKRRKSAVSDFMKTTQSKPVALYKNNVLLGCFLNATELSQKSLELYGVYLHHTSIRAICRGEREHTKGYGAKYISHEEYERILPQFQTIQNECNKLQEVI